MIETPISSEDLLNAGASELEDARTHLIEAAKFFDSAGSARLHLMVMGAIDALDQVRLSVEEYTD